MFSRLLRSAVHDQSITVSSERAKARGLEALDNTSSTAQYRGCVITHLSSFDASKASDIKLMAVLFNKLSHCKYIRFANDNDSFTSAEEADKKEKSLIDFLTPFGFVPLGTFYRGKPRMICCTTCRAQPLVLNNEERIVSFSGQEIEESIALGDKLIMKREKICPSDELRIRTYPAFYYEPITAVCKDCQIQRIVSIRGHQRPDVYALTMKQALYEMRTCPIIHVPGIYCHDNVESTKNIGKMFGLNEVQWDPQDKYSTDMVRCNRCYRN